jgi:hypothetical protein
MCSYVGEKRQPETYGRGRERRRPSFLLETRQMSQSSRRFSSKHVVCRNVAAKWQLGWPRKAAGVVWYVGEKRQPETHGRGRVGDHPLCWK